MKVRIKVLTRLNKHQEAHHVNKLIKIKLLNLSKIEYLHQQDLEQISNKLYNVQYIG